MVKIASKTSGLHIKSSYPSFKYYFEEADVPIEVEKDHVEKVLRNSNFYESDKEIPKKSKKSSEKGSWKQELIDLIGIGKKTAEDIIDVYPSKESLITELKNKAKIPFRDDVANLLKKKYLNN